MFWGFGKEELLSLRREYLGNSEIQRRSLVRLSYRREFGQAFVMRVAFDDAPEATKGFLLNHLIHELLPAKSDGHRYANSDPITGQAAWFDLRVNIVKCDPQDECLPAFPPITPQVRK